MEKTTNNIIGNYAIARYLGFPTSTNKHWWYHPDREFKLGQTIGCALTQDMCRFSESFDWIIPVARKIMYDSNPSNAINTDAYGDVSILLGELCMDVENLSARDDISKWYEVIVEFCELYNDLHTKGKIKNILPK